MTEFKPDYTKYVGLSPDEAMAAIRADRAAFEAEQEARADAEDPRTRASVAAVERHAAEKAAAEQRKAAEEERQAAAAVMENERARLLRNWQNNGGTAGEFDRAWPQLKERLLIDKAAAFERERYEIAFKG